MEEEVFKRCCFCGQTLSVDSFAKNRATLDGLQARCRDCHAIAVARSKEARRLRGDRDREWDHVSDRECKKCLVVKPIGEFYLHDPSRSSVRRAHVCRACVTFAMKAREDARPPSANAEASRRRYARDWKKRRDAARKRYNQIKEAIFDRLGHVCVRCGFADKRALQFDHVNGDGVKESRSISTSLRMKRMLEDTSGRYQVLCANCNWIKRVENDENPARPDFSPPTGLDSSLRRKPYKPRKKS